MADLLPNPWHLVVPGKLLAVHCGSTVEGQTRVRSRWLASCERCLELTEPCAAVVVEPTEAA